ncbi:transmembrane protein 213 [Anolis carolinensis]|uniref:transmembrane protein 213 n=1 Tax=Anolis carolinensis TaxID=28377 RepID=UPI000462D6E7|nr:PREDICTED: transmembrane protein 213 [Anolis carolinensis]|eukprot:XP_008108753.1 PREDICTED: transmembrane protein 213 [Anolis carolinensis]
MDLLFHFAATVLLLLSVSRSAFSEETEVHSGNNSCPDPEFCTLASKCCQFGVDDYGWIAAAVGWSLWFITLILLCIDKIMKLKPDEPKYLEA